VHPNPDAQAHLQQQAQMHQAQSKFSAISWRYKL
jgi:hypothetical protein